MVKGAKRKPKERSGRRYIEWAKLLKRVFKVDITKCSCGGEVKIISSITDPAIIMSILEHLNLAFACSGPMPAMAPPEEQLFLW